jgi:PilZ domain
MKPTTPNPNPQHGSPYAKPGQISTPAGQPGAPKPHAGAGQPHHIKRGSTTRPMTSEERRRAQRVLLRMPIHVHLEGKTNAIPGHTHTVSENGAMLSLPDPLPENSKLTIENVKSQKKVEARVVRPPQMSSEGALVPVEFLTPSPGFWNIFFPPVVN